MFGFSILKIVWILLWVLIVATCVFALRMGGAPEKRGAALILAVAVIALLIDIFVPREVRGVGHLVNDAVLAIGFLVVALRYASLWLGGAMIFQSVQFSLHAFYFLTERKPDLLYFVVNDIDTLAILACLLAGSIATIRRRRAAAAKAAAAAAAVPSQA